MNLLEKLTNALQNEPELEWRTPNELAVMSSNDGQVLLAYDDHAVPLDPDNAEYVADKLMEAAAAARATSN